LILHQEFASRELGALDERDGERFSSAEKQYFSSLADPRPSMCARLLAKELISAYLRSRGLDLPDRLLEILPAEGQGTTGVPTLRTPGDLLPGGLDFRISLSHSRARVAALLIVQERE